MCPLRVLPEFEFEPSEIDAISFVDRENSDSIFKTNLWDRCQETEYFIFGEERAFFLDIYFP